MKRCTGQQIEPRRQARDRPTSSAEVDGPARADAIQHASPSLIAHDRAWAQDWRKGASHPADVRLSLDAIEWLCFGGLAMTPFRIGFLLYPNLTQLDLTGPAQILHRIPGAELHYLWKNLEPILSDCGLVLMPTMVLAEAPQ